MVIVPNRALRFAVAALATSAVVVPVAGWQPPSAHADTARLVVDARPANGGPARAAIVITGTDGSVRTLGPYGFPALPYGLRRSPDGRYFAVPWGEWGGGDRGLAIVPTGGGAPFVLFPRRPQGRSYYVYPEDLSWTSDSRFVVFGNAEDQDGGFPGDVVRCSVAARSCAAVPGVDGYAAVAGNAIVTSSSSDALLRLVADGASPLDITSMPVDRAERRALNRRRTARTARITPRRKRVLLRHTASVLEGADAAAGIVGGPSGALIIVDRFRLRLARHDGEVFTRPAGATRRWIIVGPRGSTRTVRPRHLVVPRDDASVVVSGPGTGKRVAQRIAPEPRAPMASDGWLAVTGAPSGNRPGTPSTTAGTSGLVLTTITPAGRASFVRTGGRLASATRLVRSALTRSPLAGSPDLDVVGHEAATNAAIVVLSWRERTPPPADAPSAVVPGVGGIFVVSPEDRRYHATVRVPLDGRTPPTVVSRMAEQEAW